MVWWPYLRSSAADEGDEGGSRDSDVQQLRGSRGLPLVGETLEFARDPLRFVDARVSRYGSVFSTYIAGRRFGATAVAASYRAALDVLLGDRGAVSASRAYAEYLDAVFHPRSNLVLADDDPGPASQHSSLRAAFDYACAAPACIAYRPTVDALIQKHVANLRAVCARSADTAPLDVYVFAKVLFDELTAVLFLGEDPCAADFAESDTRRWRSEHFSAIVAVPVQVDVSSVGLRSGFTKGIQARDALLSLLRRRVREEHSDVAGSDLASPRTVLQNLARTQDEGQLEAVAHHLLVLSNAVTYKSLAAILTFLFFELVERPDLVHGCRESDDVLRACVQEALRLHPPLLGSMRMVKHESAGAVVGGRKVPAGHRLWWSARHANTDPNVYPAPHEFNPERWLSAAVSSRKIGGCPFAFPNREFASASSVSKDLPCLTFGAGDRRCPGRDIAWEVLEATAKSLLAEFDITRSQATPDVTKLPQRHFPVLRPEGNPLLYLRPRSTYPN